jgi:hypothetical protein
VHKNRLNKKLNKITFTLKLELLTETDFNYDMIGFVFFFGKKFANRVLFTNRKITFSRIKERKWDGVRNKN